MTTAWALVIAVVLLVGNAFFVAAEFALVASKRHRLEEAAAGGSRAAAAAVRGSHELSLMLAGAQLGITLCTLGLGAVAKPALAYALDPLFTAVGLPEELSYVLAFLLAVAVVVFLHMVVGEMAPKSWAISHPERSAVLLALPFRAFTTFSRPVLAALNAMANGLLRVVGITPQDTLAQVHGPDELRLLLGESRERGLLAEQQHQMLTGVLRVQASTIAEVMTPREQLITVPLTARASMIEDTSRDSGRSRLVVVDGVGTPLGIVHVREAIRATAAQRPATAQQLMTSPLVLTVSEPVAAAVKAMRGHRAQLALVAGTDREVVGLAALEDLLEEILGEFDDETDRPIATAVHRPVADS